MSLLSNLFGKFSAKQYIDVSNSKSTTINQAGNDIIINNNIPTLFGIKSAKKIVLEIQELIDMGKFSKADAELIKWITTDGFGDLPANKRVDFYYTRGLIAIIRDDIQLANQCIENIIHLNIDDKKANELILNLAVHQVDEKKFECEIKKLEKTGAYSNEIVIWQSLFSLARGNGADQVINDLSKDEKIKNEFKDNENARFYLGAAWLEKEERELAKIEFEGANQIKYSWYREFLILTIDVTPIINRRGVIKLITKSDRELLEAKLKRMEELKEFLNEQKIALQIDYWANVCTILLFLEPSKVFSIVGSLSKQIQTSQMIQLVLADAYSLDGNDQNAEPIYERLFNETQDSEILIKLLQTMQQNNRSNILEFLKLLPYSVYDSKGFTAGLYIELFAVKEKDEMVITKISELEEIFSNGPLFYSSCGLVAFQHDRIEDSKQFIEKSISLLLEDNDPLRFEIAAQCSSMGYSQQAIAVLKPFYKYSIKAFEYLLSLLIKSNDIKNWNDAERLILEAEANGLKYPFLLGSKADLLTRMGKISPASQAWEKLYEIEPSDNTAYNVLLTKIQTGNVSNCQLYIQRLQKSCGPVLAMMAASAMSAAKIGGVEEQAYRALYLLNNEFNETVYLEYIWLYLPEKRSSHNETKIDFEKVVTDTVLRLRDSRGCQRLICIDSEIDIIKNDGEITIGCEHYKQSSSITIKLLGLSKGDKVVLDNESFRIIEIINKFVYSFRHCLNIYTEKRPDSPALRSIKVTGDDPITPLIPVLERARVADKVNLDHYNFANRIGLPLIVMAHGHVDKYLDTIGKLLETKNQKFFAGAYYKVENSPIVISLASLIVMKLLKVLDSVVSNIQNVYLPKSLIDELQKLFQDATSIDQHTIGSMAMDDTGSPIFIPITPEQINARVNFWRDILDIASKCNIVESVPEVPSSEVNFEYFSRFELDCISLNNELEGTLVYDDHFMRKLANCLYPAMKTSNCIGLLEVLLRDNPDRFLDTMVILTEVEYEECCTEALMLEIINSIVKEPIILAEGTRICRFRTILRNLLFNPSDFSRYISIFSNIISQLYANKINIRNIVIMETIIKEIKVASLKQKGIDDYRLIKIILAGTSPIDVVKSAYIKDLYKEAIKNLPI